MDKPTREEYETARAEYGKLAKVMQEAHDRGDYKRRSEIARQMIPLEDVLNAYEAEEEKD